MTQALPSRASAVIDSALAACSDVKKATLYVDLQLHESVVTVCSPQGDSVRIEDQAVFPGVGMSQIQNSLARHISDLLIENYRFDPLHSSATEQAIFDQLPHWLQRLRWENDVSIKLATEQGEHPCILTRSAIRALMGERLERVRSFLDKWQGCDLALSNASGLLTGLADEFAEAAIVNQTAGIQRCLSRHEEIREQTDGLYRLRELRSSRPGTTGPATNGEPLATHVLCGDLALPLSKPVSIRVGEQGLSVSNALDESATLTVVLRNRSLEALQGAADDGLPPSCRPGESIRVGGHELRLIRVGND
jgi:hypothetical protein